MTSNMELGHSAAIPAPTCDNSLVEPPAVGLDRKISHGAEHTGPDNNLDRQPEPELVASESAVFDADLLEQQAALSAEIAAFAAATKLGASEAAEPPVLDEPLREYPGTRQRTPFMYEALLEDSLSDRADNDRRAIAFVWYPRNDMWTKDHMLWRTLRTLSACRPGIDIVALPNLPDAHLSFEMWCEVYGLQEWQAVWFDPLLAADGMHCSEKDAAADPSNLVLQNVLNELLLTAEKIGQYPSQFHVYHSHATSAVRDAVLARGLSFLGDVDEHHIINSLQEAKGWLHADYDGTSSRPSLAAELRRGGIGCASVRIPRGYVCYTAEEQFEAFRKLKASEPTPRLVLKPSDGFFSVGVVLDAKEEDLAPRNSHPWVKGESYIIEEMIGAPGGPSPTVYMCGKTAVVVADQIISGTALQGNFVPSSMPSATQQAMADTGAAIAEFLGLKGHWGMDFAIDEASQQPVVVDLNMGRPNGSLSFFLWRSQQVPRPDIVSSGSEQLCQCVIERFGPAGETPADVVRVLRDHGLLWLPGSVEGAVPVYCLSTMSHERRPFPHSDTKLIIASWAGRDALNALIARLRNVDTVGQYKAFEV